MEKNEDSGSAGGGASFIMQTTEEIARVVYSSTEDSGGHLQKLQNQVSRVLIGLSHPTEEKSTFNPEVLTTQKRQWASFQLQAMHRRMLKEPSRLFESMVVVGLHPNSDIQSGSGRLQNAINGQHQSTLAVANLEPQVLFVYPPDKQLPLKYRDLLSFCFPGGVEVNAVERTPSMSELNDILLGQEHLKQSDLSFIFRIFLSVLEYFMGADDLILYGCCLVADELVQKTSRLISMMSDGQPGILSASVLSIIPLIRPYHWQSFLMPALPNDMLDFLNAPVPFIVGVKHKTVEVQSKTANVIFVDVNKNQMRSSSLPHLPDTKNYLQPQVHTTLSLWEKVI